MKLRLFIALILMISLTSISNSKESQKSWYGIFYLSMEHDTNPIHVQAQDPTHQDDYLASAYLNLAKIWKPKSTRWRAKHELHYYEARYEENDSLNFRLIGLNETLTYRTKTPRFSIQIKNVLALEHFDVDDQDFLYTYAYRPEVILFHKTSELYYIINAQLNFSKAYRNANRDNEGGNRQLKLTTLKRFQKDWFKSSSFSLFINDHDPNLEDLQYLELGVKAQLELMWPKTGLKIIPSLTWAKEDYPTISGFDRKDKEFSSSLHLQKLFRKVHSVDLGFSYTDHQSNNSTEEYDKLQTQLNYGFVF